MGSASARMRSRRAGVMDGWMMEATGEATPLDFDQLEAGHDFAPTSYLLTAEAVEAYREAVGDAVTPPTEAPPMAVAACGMAALARMLTIPPGAIHTAQEMQFLRPVPPGSRLQCQARVVQKQARARFRMLAVELAISTADGPALVQKTTLIFPEASAGAMERA